MERLKVGLNDGEEPFFNPVVTSLRGLQQTTTLAKVQEHLGVRPTSLSALRAAAYVFDATLLHEVLLSLGTHLRPQLPLAEHAALAQLIAVDGRLVPALPRMAWALWQDDQHRAAKRPVAFAVLRQGPIDVMVTAGNGSDAGSSIAARATGTLSWPICWTTITTQPTAVPPVATTRGMMAHAWCTWIDWTLSPSNTPPRRWSNTLPEP